MKIGNRLIGVKHKPFIVAELSGNHSGSLKNALKLIKLAKNQVQMQLRYKHTHLTILL